MTRPVRFPIEGAEALGAKRQRLAALRTAVEALKKVSVAVPRALLDEMEALEDEQVVVRIPCLLCTRSVDHVIAVDDRTWPRAAVCGPCANEDDATVV